jgi:hypothetical protein
MNPSRLVDVPESLKGNLYRSKDFDNIYCYKYEEEKNPKAMGRVGPLIVCKNKKGKIETFAEEFAEEHPSWTKAWTKKNENFVIPEDILRQMPGNVMRKDWPPQIKDAIIRQLIVDFNPRGQTTLFNREPSDYHFYYSVQLPDDEHPKYYEMYNETGLCLQIRGDVGKDEMNPPRWEIKGSWVETHTIPRQLMYLLTENTQNAQARTMNTMNTMNTMKENTQIAQARPMNTMRGNTQKTQARTNLTTNARSNRTFKAWQDQARGGASGKKAKVHTGPRGGKYIMKKGKKVYISG